MSSANEIDSAPNSPRSVPTPASPTPSVEYRLPPPQSIHPLNLPIPGEVEAIRTELHATIASEIVDKPTSVILLRLFYGMESLLLHQVHTRMREGAELRHTIERGHMHAELDRLNRRRTLEDMQMPGPTSSPSVVARRR